jgi:hypothetical protein
MQLHCPTAPRPVNRNSSSAWVNIGVRFTLRVNFTGLTGADYSIIYKYSHSMKALFLLQCDLYLNRLIQSRHRLKDNIIMRTVSYIERLKYIPDNASHQLLT